MADARRRIFERVWLTAFVGLAVASGCATVPMATREDSARLKRLAAPPDAAVVYVYRNESYGAGVHMDVSLDGRPYGQTVASSYMVWQVAPGSHRLVSSAEDSSELTLDAAAGRRYFVWQEVKMGLMYARSRLQQVTPTVGQAGVDECELIQMPLPPPREQRPPPPAPAAAPPPPPPAEGAPTVVPGTPTS